MTLPSVFALARMRRLDLLALWHQMHPDGHHGTDGRGGCGGAVPARLSKDWLVTAILEARAPRT